jgi:hypothetical protein
VTVIPSEIDIQDQATREALSDLHTCMPGEVVAVRSGSSDARQFVDVLPLLQREVVDEDGEPQSEAYPVLQMVPVGYMQGGGFFLSLPMRIGDTVLLVFAERSLDSWLQTATPGARTPVVPGDLSTHSLQGAIALPWGPAPRSALLAGVDGSDAVLGLRDGTILARFTPAGGVVFAEGVNFVALANLVLTELNRLWTAVGAHTHVVATTGSSSAQTGTAAAAGSQGTANSVAATKTKAT